MRKTKESFFDHYLGRGKKPKNLTQIKMKKNAVSCAIYRRRKKYINLIGIDTKEDKKERNKLADEIRALNAVQENLTVRKIKYRNRYLKKKIETNPIEPKIDYVSGETPVISSYTPWVGADETTKLVSNARYQFFNGLDKREKMTKILTEIAILLTACTSEDVWLIYEYLDRESVYYEVKTKAEADLIQLENDKFFDFDV